MKKLLVIAGLILGITSVGALSGATSDTAAAAPRCTAKAVGERSKAYAINGNTATVKFRVTGPKNCRVQLSSNSFYAPTMNGKPYDKQILFQRVTKVYKPGSYTMSVQLPPRSTKAKGCFYQVDLTYGTYNKTPVLAYGHGKVPCGAKPTMIEVCDLKTKTVITINQKNFDREKHSRNLDDCKEEPKMIEVCVIETKERTNIREDEFDSEIHTTDFSICEDEPEVPEEPKNPKVEEAPAELPETGPMESVAQMLGVGSLVGSLGYYLQSRRQ